MSDQFIFHTGQMYAKGSATNATPQAFGTLQSGAVDFAFTTKPLMGQYNFPVAVGQGACKITGKASAASIKARQFNDIFFGTGTLSAGETLVASNEAGSIPASVAYTVTVLNSTTFVEDWGVTYAATGETFIKVASAPAKGQYTVAAGVFTFAAADASTAVLISYSYTSTTVGQKLSVSQQLVGSAPTFTLVLSGNFNGMQTNLKLYACVASKLSLATKQNDFAIPAFEFEGLANAAGQVLDWSNGDPAA